MQSAASYAGDDAGKSMQCGQIITQPVRPTVSSARLRMAARLDAVIQYEVLLPISEAPAGDMQVTWAPREALE